MLGHKETKKNKKPPLPQIYFATCLSLEMLVQTSELVC